MSRKRKHNMGYSLVELVVVIAIMVVLAGAGISMTGLIPRNQVRKCAKNIITLVEKTRTEAMSFQDARLTIYRMGDGVYADMYVKKQGAESLVSTTLLGDEGIRVEFDLDDGSHFALGSGSEEVEKLTLRFDRSSGSFQNSILEPDKGIVATCSAIRISKGSAESILKLVKLTGKIGY